jgi:hypothetical protein
MRPDEVKVANVGGVWNTNPWWPALTWGRGVDAGVKYLELVAEDYTFTFKTVEQIFPFNLNKPYGPKETK